MNGVEPYLEGVAVLDLTQYLAGPSCTRLLVELGADVIKVEPAPNGDRTRDRVPARGGRAGVFIQQNRGKRSLCLDLGRPEGIAVVKELAAHVDVVVENFTPGVLDRKGLGWADLSAVNPRLVMASISGFGQTGPWRDRTCFDFIAQAMAGVMHMTGEPDGPPTFVGHGIGDTNAGVHAFAGIATALFRRERTGRGAHIDVAMVDALFHMHEYAVMAPGISDGAIVPHRQGRYYQPATPAGVFKGPEGWIVLLCTQDQVAYLWAAMDRPELGADPRFATNADRNAHRDELAAIIDAWMATFATDAEVIDRLAAHRVPCGPVLNPAQAKHHPHFQGRGLVRTVEDPYAGTFDVPAFPLRFDPPSPEPPLPTASLGEHNRAVLGGVLGWDEQRIAALEASGVLRVADR